MNMITRPAPEPGIYRIPEDDYHASPGLSVSKLKVFADAPAKAQFGERSETSTQRFGSLIHCAVLESADLENRYFVCDLDRLNPRDGVYKEAQAKAGHRTLVKRPDWDEALRIRDAVHQHPIAQELLGQNLLVEQSFYWNDEMTGLLRRGRADGLRPDMRVIVDLKSTADASRYGFARSVADYRYHWQDAFYRDGITAVAWEPEAFIFLAVEKEAPFLVGAYEVPEEDLQRGRERVREELIRYAECVRTNHWPGYSDTLETLHLPEWAHR
ncbi:PD-(D/E)XK nuclease-like domain-containing protein [Azospirillum aestuarii]|uniref:PD-(D/E)XK nuclease-like domain-containing protein n=1 Tax=Azospirillum aestuarii TaxID=2802052 RepID=UPI004054C8FC